LNGGKKQAGLYQSGFFYAFLERETAKQEKTYYFVNEI